MPTTKQRDQSAGKKRQNAPVTLMEETLAEFAEQMDAHLGRATGFADAARDWRKYTDEANVLAPRGQYRTAIADRLDRFIGTDQAVVQGKPLQHRWVGGGTRRVLRSAAVSRANPELWEASRPTMRIMAVKHHLALPPVLAVPRMRTPAEAWEALRIAQTRATSARQAAADARAVFMAAVDDCADVWDGSRRVTADGWTVGVDPSQRFNEAVCRKLAEQRGIDLTPLEEETHSDGRLVYAVGEVIVDEFDGD
jgi:hypothetical protein